MNTYEILSIEERCDVCKKRKATKLCDKVISEYRYCGHPPKTSSGHFLPGIDLVGTITCDKKLCDRCAVHITGMDLCPDCFEEIKNYR